MPKFRSGDHVGYSYRGAHPVGTVVGIATKGTTPATTRYRVRPPARRVSDSGSREAATVIHTGAALHKVSDATYAAGVKRAHSRKFKRQNGG